MGFGNITWILMRNWFNFSHYKGKVAARAPGPFSFNLGHILHYFFEWGVRSASCWVPISLRRGEAEGWLTFFFLLVGYKLSSSSLYPTDTRVKEKAKQSKTTLLLTTSFCLIIQGRSNISPLGSTLTGMGGKEYWLAMLLTTSLSLLGARWKWQFSFVLDSANRILAGNLSTLDSTECRVKDQLPAWPHQHYQVNK